MRVSVTVPVMCAVILHAPGHHQASDTRHPVDSSGVRSQIAAPLHAIRDRGVVAETT